MVLLPKVPFVLSRLVAEPAKLALIFVDESREGKIVTVLNDLGIKKSSSFQEVVGEDALSIDRKSPSRVGRE
jgi:hypothetical protein